MGPVAKAIGGEIWRAFCNWIISKFKKPVATDPLALNLGFDPLPLATAIVGGAADALKVYGQIKTVADDPAHMQAAEAQQKLAEIDKLVIAQKSHDLATQAIDAENARQ